MKRAFLFLILLWVQIPLPAQEVRRAIPVNSVETAGMQIPGADDDLARYLAGIPLLNGSPLAALQNTPAYAAHREALQNLWQRYWTNYYQPMRAWSSVELATRLNMRLPLFYFFGGPDAIHAMALYPGAPVYILGGLESVGSIAPPQGLDPAIRDLSLAGLRESVEVVLSYGHFITKDMKEDLEKSSFRGVLPVIFAFMALSGGEILQTDYIGIAKGGTLKEHGNAYRGSKSELPGIRISFRQSPAAPPQTLYYIQANVADDPLKTNPAVLEWAGSQGPGNSYLKAASYLMHESYFSRIRNFLLQNSRSILQDDSGIPLSEFQTGDWQLTFFGTYSGTLEIFKKYHQPNLAAAFSSPAVRPLPFGTGYKWRPGESNLTLAVKEGPARALPAQLESAGPNTP